MCLFYRGDVFSQPLVVYLRVHWKYEPRGLRVSLWDPQWLQGLRPWSRKRQICRLLPIRRTPWLVYKLYKSCKKDNWRQVCNLWVFQEITKNDKLQGIRTLAKLGHSNFEFWATLLKVLSMHLQQTWDLKPRIWRGGSFQWIVLILYLKCVTRDVNINFSRSEIARSCLN